MVDKYNILQLNFDFYRKVINEVKNLSLINDDVILDKNEVLYTKYVDNITNLLNHYNKKSLSRYIFIYTVNFIDMSPYSIDIQYHVFDSKSNTYKILFQNEIDFESVILNRNIKLFYKNLDRNNT